MKATCPDRIVSAQISRWRWCIGHQRISPAQRNCNHPQIGTRSHAEKAAAKDARGRPPGDDAGNRGAVRSVSCISSYTGFINGTIKELFRDDLAGEGGMTQIDAGIDQPDGHARARLHAWSVSKFKVCPGLGCLHGAQRPLDRIRPIVLVTPGNPVALLIITFLWNAAEGSGLNVITRGRRVRIDTGRRRGGIRIGKRYPPPPPLRPHIPKKADRPSAGQPLVGSNGH